MLISLGEGQEPHMAPTACVCPNTTVAGRVVLADGVIIWYNTVLLADNEPITIGVNTNVQDNCAFHVDTDLPLVLGDGVSVGHGAIVHGATVADHVLI